MSGKFHEENYNINRVCVLGVVGLAEGRAELCPVINYSFRSTAFCLTVICYKLSSGLLEGFTLTLD